jgi:hypothetical protein
MILEKCKGGSFSVLSFFNTPGERLTPQGASPSRTGLICRAGFAADQVRPLTRGDLASRSDGRSNELSGVARCWARPLE